MVSVIIKEMEKLRYILFKNKYALIKREKKINNVDSIFILLRLLVSFW
jgi:hypothetical protein